WSDYRHLNLFVRAPNAASWTVSLPANATRAVFRSAIAIGAGSGAARDATGADGVAFDVSIDQDGAASQLAFSEVLTRQQTGQRQWRPFTVALGAYAGKTITLRLAARGRAGDPQGDWAVYRYPTIAVQLDTAIPSPAAPVRGPALAMH